MILIGIVTIILYFVLIAWTWHNLGTFEKSKKLIYLVLGILLIYGFTFIIFQVSKNGIVYETIQIHNSVQTLLIVVFSGINGIIIMPQIAKILEEMKENNQEKILVKRKIILLLIILFLCFIFESGYMKTTQEGILQVYYSMK